MAGALLDTNAVSDLMRDHPSLKARAAAYPGRLCTSVIVDGEIRFGLERLPVGKKRTDLEARALAVLASLPHEPVSELIGEELSVSRAAALRKRSEELQARAGDIERGSSAFDS